MWNRDNQYPGMVSDQTFYNWDETQRERLMIISSITDLMDEQKCYDRLVIILRPNGLNCDAGFSPPVMRRHTIRPMSEKIYGRASGWWMAVLHQGPCFGDGYTTLPIIRLSV